MALPNLTQTSGVVRLTQPSKTIMGVHAIWLAVYKPHRSRIHHFKTTAHWLQTNSAPVICHLTRSSCGGFEVTQGDEIRQISRCELNVACPYIKFHCAFMTVELMDVFHVWLVLPPARSKVQLLRFTFATVFSISVRNGNCG